MLYVMLCGRYPFEPLNASKVGSSTTLKVINAIIAGVWSFPAGSSVTPACEQLLVRLLAVNAEERMTMRELMKSEWYLTNLPPETHKMNDLFFERSASDASYDPEDVQIKHLLEEAMRKQRSLWKERQSKEVYEEAVILATD